MSQNSTASDPGLDINFSWVSQGALGLFHLVTSAWLASFFRLLYRRIEIGHPVFAVILQDTVVMALCNALATLGLPVLAAMDKFQLWVDVASRMAVTSVQFHQTSWLVISCIRIYLTKTTANPDYAVLTKFSITVTWMLTLAITVIFYVVRTLMIPGGFASDNFMPKDEDEVQVRYLVLLAALLITNIPDYLSVVLYVIFYRPSKNNGVVEPEPTADAALDDGGEGEEPFGGIYVGDPRADEDGSPPVGAAEVAEVPLAIVRLGSAQPPVKDELQGHPNYLPGALPDADAVQAAPVKAGQLCAELNQRLDSAHRHSQNEVQKIPQHPLVLLPPAAPHSPVTATASQQEAKCAVQALRTHALTCTMDFSLLVLVLLPVNEASILTLYLVTCAMAYWLPVLAAVHNFGKLRKMLWDVCCEFFN